MRKKKVTERYTLEDLASTMIFPVKLTKAQQKQAAIELAEARKKSQAAMSEETRISLRLFQLKFRLEEYIHSKEYDPTLTFGYFLKEYIRILDKKRKTFAAEISIDESLLSQLINQHRMPPDYISVRLELHSDNMIPASYWYKLVEKQKEHFIKTDASLRAKEKPFVHGGLRVQL